MKRIIIDRKDKEQTTKNINEIEIFKQLNNDNLIKYFNSFIHKDKLCIVMEYADDGDLHSKIEKHLNEKKLIPENLDYDGLFDDLFQKYTHSSHLERVKTTNMGTLYELDYRIVLREEPVPKEFLDALRCRNGNLNIVCGRVASKETL